jgi:hypothetical protein
MKKVLIILFTIISIFSIAQKQGNIWCFADSSGIDFNSGNAILYPNSIISSSGGLEPQASISDKNGNLLFYSDGTTVWNNENLIMQNGSGLNCYSSNTQGVIIIPKPNDSLKYFVFIINSSGLYYNLIDISLDSGKGGIIIGYKNVPILLNNLSEKQIAVKHANGRDWWLIVHQDNSQQFYDYLITPDTIELMNSQKIGSTYNLWGEMEISQKGDKLVSVGMFDQNPNTKGYIDLFDFDRCSGLLNNYEQIGDTSISSYYGCSLSPSGQILYISNLYDTLFQYNLLSPDIKASKQVIWIDPYYNNIPFPSGYGLGQHQLGPDGKIYISLFYLTCPNSIHSFQNENLCVINSPDSLGLACDFMPNSFNLGSHRVEIGLPNVPNYNLGALEGSPCDTLTGINELPNNENKIKIYPNPSIDNIIIESPQKSEIEILNIQGQLIKVHTASSDKTNIDISSFPIGMYIVKVKTENAVPAGRQGITVKKFVKE